MTRLSDTPRGGPAKRRNKTGTGRNAALLARQEARRRDLAQRIRRDGLHNVDLAAWAREQKVSRATAYRDLDTIAQSIPREHGRLVALAALQRLERADQEFRALLSLAGKTVTTDDGVTMPAIQDSVRLAAAKALRESALAELDVLRRLGIIEDHTKGLGTDAAPIVVRMWQPGDPEAPSE